MHSRKVLHRDIKAQNIFLLGNGRLVLGDLGISKVRFTLPWLPCYTLVVCGEATPSLVAVGDGTSSALLVWCVLGTR